MIDRLHQQGSLKSLFPRTDGDALTAVLLNTAGGITGGDRFDMRLDAQTDTQLVVTTQACERVYRAAEGRGHVHTGLRIGTGARINWLPQETILFNGAALARRLDVTLEVDARALLVESVVFGRAAMGERLTELDLDDRISVRRDGRILFADRTRLHGDCAAHMKRNATGQDAGAMASLVYAAPDAADLMAKAREILPRGGGVSQPAPGVLFARLLAPDGFELRRVLLRLIDCFSDVPLPRPWMI